MSRFDHYSARRAALTAHGDRKDFRRLVARALAALSIVPVILIDTDIVGNGVTVRCGFLAISACAVLMAYWWWRERWPSRVQSLALVAFGTVAIAGICMSMTDQRYGLLGMATFGLVGCYAALFHSTRTRNVIRVVCAAAVVFQTARVAEADVRLAAAGFIVVAVVVGGVSGVSSAAALLFGPGSERHPNEIEPLTGMLNRRGFDIELATRIGSYSRKGDAYLVVVVVQIVNLGVLLHDAGSGAVKNARIEVGRAVRYCVRRDAAVAHVSDDEFLVADVFSTPDATPLLERIRQSAARNVAGATLSVRSANAPVNALRERPVEDSVDILASLAT